jgi:hypothetical protein
MKHVRDLKDLTIHVLQSGLLQRMAHTIQTRPDSGCGLQIKALNFYEVVTLHFEAECTARPLTLPSSASSARSVEGTDFLQPSRREGVEKVPTESGGGDSASSAEGTDSARSAEGSFITTNTAAICAPRRSRSCVKSSFR